MISKTLLIFPIPKFLSLSDVDSTMFACIAFSCPNLQSMKIRTMHKAINRITGFLTSLKIEGCSNLGSLTLLSSSLSILWISDLYCLSKMGKRTILVSFPPAARRMDMLNDLLPSSALISLHCALTNETVQIINAERLQHVKPVLLAVRWMVLNGHNGWIMGISIDLMVLHMSPVLFLVKSYLKWNRKQMRKLVSHRVSSIRIWM
ncbi:uncharacterized protein LOC113331450 [Papaver somniferum]|uniref:uncharacterized protein LOC113331450 n=1 Tax=Papaver somniferum TaxID=3469 RepID=UPI000E701FA7|nr:uncharacterized protein LOC113331450 [Papaver somniferum]XP_026433941.1 uncharacterized protein LOC113331450 [Papaver somniferum]XP_026433942.1 uncharacterized protein LOC113331450 [Papaver somniferum]XP_026433943.1 uncharacterized protein LOC113331450 [Papaver somniferum]